MDMGDPDVQVTSVDTWDSDCIILSAMGPGPSDKGKGKAPVLINGSWPGNPQNQRKRARKGVSDRVAIVLDDSSSDETPSHPVTSSKVNARCLQVVDEVDALTAAPPPEKKKCSESSSVTVLPSSSFLCPPSPPSEVSSSPSITPLPSSCVSPSTSSSLSLTHPTRGQSSSTSPVPMDTTSPIAAATTTTVNASHGPTPDCYIDADFQLALKLNEELNGPAASDTELARRLQNQESGEDSDCQILADQTLAKQLQEEENKEDQQQLLADQELAKKLQELEDQKTVKFIKATTVKVKLPPTDDGPSTSSNMARGTEISAGDTTIDRRESYESSPSPVDTDSSYREEAVIGPPWWKACTNCPPDAVRRYHLLEVEYSCKEWQQVSSPLTNRGLTVTKLQRIQNATLWQRFQLERQLMMQSHPDGFSVNETLLYHTSRADKATICEEGLDQRLSRRGQFGTGIYFSDDPLKCDLYSPINSAGKRIMFACCVLLGDTKVYQSRTADPELRREPLKPNPKLGEPKTYDSVQGNITGQNEFVVYNTYRVLPEYVVEYQHGRSATPTHRTSVPTTVSIAKETLTQLLVLQEKLSKPRPPSKKQCRRISATLYVLEKAVPSYMPPPGARSSMALIARVQALKTFVSMTLPSTAAGSSTSSNAHVPAPLAPSTGLGRTH